MSRHAAMLLWVRTIPIATALVVLTACSGPTREAAKDASPPKESGASPVQAPSKPPAPPAPVAVARAPRLENEPTPAETPVTPPPAPVTAAAGPKSLPPEPAPDPLKWLQETEARRVEYEKSLVQLAADRDTAKDLVARAERDLLAFRNPYLARPVLTPDQAAEIQGMNGIDRVKWAEARLAGAIAALESAQKAYDDAKANPPGN
jgi:hypothetical protein